MLLAFDTATSRVTVALADGDQVLATATGAEDMRHGELLAPGIAEVLEKAGAIPTDITAVAVGVGPGPFTGLRVGLVTARTLGHALGIPVYGVCSLDIVAAAAVDGGLSDFVVATDARRKEVYLAEYRDGRRVSGPEVLKAAELDPERAALTAVGRGVALYPDAFAHPGPILEPDAAVLCGVVAGERYELLDPEPLYLRRPDAVAGLSGKRVS